MTRLAIVVGGVWLLVGCSAAELEAFNDSMNCINSYPDNTLAQNECMYRMNAYRDQQRTNDLVRWCNSEVIAPMNRSFKWLDARLPEFERDYQRVHGWVYDTSDHFDTYCDTPEERRASSYCGRAILESGLNEANNLLARIDPLLTEEQRVQALVQSYNNECTSIPGSEWMDVHSNLDFLNGVRSDAMVWRDAFSRALAQW